MLMTGGLAHPHPVITPPQSLSKTEPVQTICLSILADHPPPRNEDHGVMALAIIADENLATIPKVT